MNKNTEEKIINFLRTLATDTNWELWNRYNSDGTFAEIIYSWEKEGYDPKFVAEELLEELDFSEVVEKKRQGKEIL